MKKRVLQIISRFTTGGAERLILEYTRQYDKNKIELAIASVRGGGELVEAFRQTGVHLFVNNLRALWSFVRNHPPDIVHTHLLSADVAGYVLKCLYPSVRWISTQHNIETNLGFARHWLWPRLLRRADMVVAVSATVAEFCTQTWRLPANKLALIPNGIGLSPWLALASIAPTPATLHLATIGRLTRQKGHEVLFRALAAAKFSFTLDIFGDGELRQPLETLARQLGLSDRVRFRGVVGELAPQLELVDVVVQPSLWEGRSLAVMEAMAAGRGIVASRPAALELVEDGVSGIVVPPNDIPALIEALTSLARDSALAARLAQAARERAHREFGFESWLTATERLYDDAV